jgi:hypothetical protein
MAFLYADSISRLTLFLTSRAADLNLPIAGVASLITLIFMDLPTPPGTFYEKIIRLDWM